VEDLKSALDLQPSDKADDLIKQCLKNREKWVKRFKKEYRTNDEFKEWFHRDYKPDVKATSKDRLNPDLTESDLADAYLEWVETFGGG
jgi:hypothetical protein